MKSRWLDRKIWLKWLIRVTVVGLVVWGVRRTLLEGLAGLDQQSWQLRPGWLVVSGALYLAGLAPSGWFWHRLLLAMGENPALGPTLRSYFIGHLGKYVPGKAMVIVLRTGLLRSQRVDPFVAATTIFYETLTSMAVGAFVAAAIVGLWYRENWRLTVLAIAMMAAAGVPTVPPLFRWLTKALGVGKKNPILIERLATLRYRLVAAGWGSISLGWLLMGLSLWAARQSVGVDEQALFEELPRYTASVAMATVAGFVSLIPGGFGIREAVLMQTLTLGTARDAESTALISAVLLRLVWLLSELAISGILYVWGWIFAGREGVS